MGMNINTNINTNINYNRLKTDYSSLFSSMMGSGSGSGLSGLAGLLGDYSSIKNGSYGKLLKSYYQEAVKGTSSSASSSDTKKTVKTGGSSITEKLETEKKQRQHMVESSESKAYTGVKSSTGKLMLSLDKLSATGDSSVFAKKDIMVKDENGDEIPQYGYDKEAIYSAVSEFVGNYNSVIQAADNAGNYTISNRVTSMQNETRANKDVLNQFGITINTNGTLSVNKDNFMKADMGRVQELFSKGGSYTKALSATASMIQTNANYEQLRGNTYTYDGTFDSAYKNGSSFSSSL